MFLTNTNSNYAGNIYSILHIFHSEFAIQQKHKKNMTKTEKYIKILE